MASSPIKKYDVMIVILMWRQLKSGKSSLFLVLLWIKLKFGVAGNVGLFKILTQKHSISSKFLEKCHFFLFDHDF